MNPTCEYEGRVEDGSMVIVEIDHNGDLIPQQRIVATIPVTDEDYGDEDGEPYASVLNPRGWMVTGYAGSRGVYPMERLR